MALASCLTETFTPNMGCAPRVEGGVGTLRYEFRSLRDLVACLEDNTLKLIVHHIGETGPDGKVKVKMWLKGKYSDRAEGNVYWAMASDIVKEGSELKGTKVVPVLTYSLLSFSDHDYVARAAKEDTFEHYRAVMEHLAPQLSAIRNKFYPTWTESIHTPRKLKFNMPKGGGTKTYIKGKPIEEEAAFNLKEHIDAPGRLMVLMGAPWLLTQTNPNVENVMMGLSNSLARIKYYTDEEREEMQQQRKAIKRAREEEEAAAEVAVKKEREETEEGAKKSKA